jgi:hypothetical protein
MRLKANTRPVEPVFVGGNGIIRRPRRAYDVVGRVAGVRSLHETAGSGGRINGRSG